MAHPQDDKKIDLSSLPRGAIGIKGLPINRNTRLPSIRSPRDLTLGAPPKRTYTPNIPPRREKKTPTSETVAISPNVSSSSTYERKPALPFNERGRGKFRGKGQIIQTYGAVFGEGFTQNVLPRKEKLKEVYKKSDAVPSRGSFSKKDMNSDNVQNISRKMENLFRDDFIDDGDGEFEDLSKPTIFPIAVDVKKEEVKSEIKETFDENIAMEVGYDINKVARFIKVEKEAEAEPQKKLDVCMLPPNKLSDLLSQDVPELLLLQFPKCATLPQKMDDSQPKTHKGGADAEASNKSSATSIGAFPEGYAGKLQVFKSGKARLVLGSLTFDLDSVNLLQSKHEVVSLKTNSDTGDLAILGSMQHKLKFAPNVDSLLS